MVENLGTPSPKENRPLARWACAIDTVATDTVTGVYHAATNTVVGVCDHTAATDAVVGMCDHTVATDTVAPDTVVGMCDHTVATDHRHPFSLL